MISWSFFCDISGLVREKDRCPWITPCAVAIRSDEVDSVISELLDYFNGNPVKWSNSSPQDAKFILDLFRRRSLPCATVHVQRTKPEWSGFWRDARLFHNDFRQGIKKQANERHEKYIKPNFVKSGTIARYLLLIRSKAILFAICYREFGYGRIVNADNLAPFLLELTLDIEIEDEESQDLFRQIHDNWCSIAKEDKRLGVSPEIISLDFKTEEDEPLLLLPDFIAGISHQQLVTSTGSQSNLPPDLRRAVKELELPLSDIFEELKKPFTEKFPFIMKDGHVVYK